MAHSPYPLLVSLRVFEGGAPRAALQAVCELGAEEFERLLQEGIDSGRILETQPGRYDLAPGALPAADPSELSRARQRHCAWFAEWAAERAGRNDALESELPNLRAGFDAACEGPAPQDEQVIGYAACATGVFLARRDWETALNWLEQAAAACERQRDDEMLARVHARIGLTHCLRGSFQSGYDEYAKAARLLESQQDRAELAAIEGNLGLIALAIGDTRADGHLRRSALLSAQTGSRSREVQIVEHALVLLLSHGQDAAASFARSRLAAA